MPKLVRVGAVERHTNARHDECLLLSPLDQADRFSKERDRRRGEIGGQLIDATREEDRQNGVASRAASTA